MANSPADKTSNIQQIAQAVFDVATQAIKIEGSITVSPDPSAATAANQATEIALLTSIDGKTVHVDTNNVTVTSSVAPTGSATSAKQDTGNASLASIDSKIVHVDTGNVTVASSALPTGAATSTNQTTANTSLSSLDSKTVHVDTGAVVVSSSALPTGAATASNQSTANSTLSTISGQLPTTLGAKTTANSVAVNIASDQTVSVSVSNFPATQAVSGSVSVSNFPATQAVSGTVAATQSGAWTTGRTWTLANGTDSVTVQGGNTTAVKVDGSAVTQPVSGTFFQATQPVSGTVAVSNFPATQAISAASLPLPTGAATSANQTSANTSLSSLDSKTVHVDTGAVVVSSSALPTGAATESTLASLNGKVTAVNTGAVVVSSSALPTGAATAANQTTANTSLASIDSKLTSPITVTGTVTSTSSGFTRVQTPTFTAATSIPANGGTRFLVATLTGQTRRLDINDTTGLFLNWWSAVTGGTLLFISAPGQDHPLDQTIASGTTLYIESADANTSASGNLSVNYLG